MLSGVFLCKRERDIEIKTLRHREGEKGEKGERERDRGERECLLGVCVCCCILVWFGLVSAGVFFGLLFRSFACLFVVCCSRSER